MEAKIEKISELSKLSSVKTRMSDDLFHLLVNLASVTCYLAFHWKNMTGFGFGVEPFSLPIPHCG